MQDHLTRRLEQLRHEYESGQHMLADLETRQTNLRHTLLRISGAIQVLEELLEHDIGGNGALHPAADSVPLHAPV